MGQRVHRLNALTLSSADAELCRRDIRRHSAAMLREDAERAATPTALPQSSSKRVATGRGAQVRAANLLHAQRILRTLHPDADDDRVAFCMRAFGRRLKAREWRNFRRAVQAGDEALVIKLGALFTA